jgi:hypothetical protein
MFLAIPKYQQLTLHERGRREKFLAAFSFWKLETNFKIIKLKIVELILVIMNSAFVTHLIVQENKLPLNLISLGFYLNSFTICS